MEVASKESKLTSQGFTMPIFYFPVRQHRVHGGVIDAIKIVLC